jgi:hypothetical protein
MWVISGSLDGTLRRWKLSGADGLTPLWWLCPHTKFIRACRPSTAND